MKEKSKNVAILVALILVFVIINYSFLDNALKDFLTNYEDIHVDRIIDGDTIKVEDFSIRLLGINTPERGELYYQEAKEFLEERILNKTVSLEFIGERYDKYNRTLAYIFFENKNINLELVENGFANYYFYDGKDKYSNDLLEAWNVCIKNEINLCEPSVNQCSSCILIDSEFIVNACSFDCDITNWQIKGEGRDVFTFSEQVLKPNMMVEFELDLTNSDRGLFLRDEKGKLVLWEIH